MSSDKLSSGHVSVESWLVAAGREDRVGAHDLLATRLCTDRNVALAFGRTGDGQ